MQMLIEAYTEPNSNQTPHNREISEKMFNRLKSLASEGGSVDSYLARQVLDDLERKFENVSCSQCGKDFGPGFHGFSHCEDHR